MPSGLSLPRPSAPYLGWAASAPPSVGIAIAPKSPARVDQRAIATVPNFAQPCSVQIRQLQANVPVMLPAINQTTFVSGVAVMQLRCAAAKAAASATALLRVPPAVIRANTVIMALAFQTVPVLAQRVMTPMTVARGWTVPAAPAVSPRACRARRRVRRAHSVAIRGHHAKVSASTAPGAASRQGLLFRAAVRLRISRSAAGYVCFAARAHAVDGMEGQRSSTMSVQIKQTFKAASETLQGILGSRIK